VLFRSHPDGAVEDLHAAVADAAVAAAPETPGRLAGWAWFRKEPFQVTLSGVPEGAAEGTISSDLL